MFNTPQGEEPLYNCGPRVRNRPGTTKKARFVGRVLYSAMQQEEFSLNITMPEEFPVPGFFLRPEYIGREEEQDLLEKVNAGEWDTEWRRRVQRYGVSYGPTKDRTVLGPLPDWLCPLATKVQKDAGLERYPENCVINEYEPGQGIAPHKDYFTFGEKVACVSLGSDVVLDFQSEDRIEKHSILVPARCLWVISGDARFKWLHGIMPRLSDTVCGLKRKRERRVSITFRLKRNS